MLHWALGKLRVTTSTQAIWIRFRGVQKNFWSFQACRSYIHVCVSSSYFDLMTLPYRKFADVSSTRIGLFRSVFITYSYLFFPAHFIIASSRSGNLVGICITCICNISCKLQIISRLLNFCLVYCCYLGFLTPLSLAILSNFLTFSLNDKIEIMKK